MTVLRLANAYVRWRLGRTKVRESIVGVLIGKPLFYALIAIYVVGSWRPSKVLGWR